MVQITTDSGTKNVCWESLKNNAKYAVCRHLGYQRLHTLVSVPASTDNKEATFSGSINCNSDYKFLSQCSINASTAESCSQLSYVYCFSIGKNNNNIKQLLDEVFVICRIINVEADNSFRDIDNFGYHKNRIQ